MENGVFTSPTHVVRAFKQALTELIAEGGVEARYARYCENHRILVDGMRSLGFKTLLEDAIQSPIITSFLYPKAGFVSNHSIWHEIQRIRYLSGKKYQRQILSVSEISEMYTRKISNGW